MSDCNYRKHKRGWAIRVVVALALLAAFVYVTESKAEVICQRGTEFAVCILVVTPDDDEPEELEA